MLQLVRHSKILKTHRTPCFSPAKNHHVVDFSQRAWLVLLRAGYWRKGDGDEPRRAKARRQPEGLPPKASDLPKEGAESCILNSNCSEGGS
jgi:hypothetical protein